MAVIPHPRKKTIGGDAPLVRFILLISIIILDYGCIPRQVR